MLQLAMAGHVEVTLVIFVDWQWQETAGDAGVGQAAPDDDGCQSLEVGTTSTEPFVSEPR